MPGGGVKGTERQLRLARGSLTNARGTVRERCGEGYEGQARAFSLYVRSTAVCKEFRTHCCSTLCVWVTNAPYYPTESRVL